MEEEYNLLAERQRYFLAKVNNNFKEFNSIPQDDNSRQTFYQNNFGLSDEEVLEMNQVKRDVDIILAKLKLIGIIPTTNEIINGFEVI